MTVKLYSHSLRSDILIEEMSSLRVYLDYNATTPLRAEARDAMVTAMDVFGNPSSVHDEGRRAMSLVTRARQQVASLIGGQSAQLVFTSSATEALNMVVNGDWDCLIALATEHSAVLAPIAASETPSIIVGVDQNGIIALDELDAAVDAALVHGPRCLVCIQAANNETGVVQPLSRIAQRVRERGAQLLCDAVQIAGKLPFDVAALGVDYAVISSHKLGGPKGCGALWAAGAAFPPALIHGGGQEKGVRGGTENVAAISAFGAAAEAAQSSLESFDGDGHLQDSFEEQLLSAAPGAVVLGKSAARLPNTTSVAAPGCAAETLVIRLDLAGFSVSAGAACSSGKVARSHVVDAMFKDGADDRKLSSSAVRISTGWTTTQNDLTRFISAWSQIIRSSSGYRQVA
ncbi:MAG: cysteine desulfurase family protein, partial [Pseudomonadota bacterium]